MYKPQAPSTSLRAKTTTPLFFSLFSRARIRSEDEDWVHWPTSSVLPMETQFFLPYSLHHTHPSSPINPSNKGRGEGTNHDRVDVRIVWMDIVVDVVSVLS